MLGTEGRGQHSDIVRNGKAQVKNRAPAALWDDKMGGASDGKGWLGGITRNMHRYTEKPNADPSLRAG